MTSSPVREAFSRQAEACETLGSPFTACLSKLFAERLGNGSAVADRILGWQGDPSPSADSVPLRIAGCLHALVLDGRAPALAAAYPPHVVNDDQLWHAIEEATREHAGFILERLNSPPQTNEVRRSGALLPGFFLLGEMFGMPLILSEAGASAGLNLQWDRYAYDLGGRTVGAANSTVRIAPEWRGRTPPASDVEVAARAGCDLNPIDAADPSQRLRMLSYIWADQADRLDRTAHALDIAARHDLSIERADAIDWLAGRFAQRHAGAVHVVFHTIAWQYFPKTLQERGASLIAEAGAQATHGAPLARLALEADGKADGASLTLQIWPTGEIREIGRGDFHGRWVDGYGWR